MKTPNRRQKKKTRKYRTPNKFPTKLGETSLSSSATIGKKGKKKLEQWTGAIQLREMTDKRRARYRECIKKREFQKSQLQTERKNLLREIAFWKTAVVNEYNDDVFLPAPAQC